jgi:LmbE family N-acetylglucosaminyl deacetylase
MTMSEAYSQSLEAATLGSTLVFAPHPDDESLGCGGLIAMLAGSEIPVHVVVVTDGTGSHRNSRAFPAERLRMIRRQEAIDALSTLGVPEHSVTFLDLPDEKVPFQESVGFDKAVEAVRHLLERVNPETLIVPWRRDFHCDHVATWQIVSSARKRSRFEGRWLEYVIWASEFGDVDDLPRQDEVRIKTVDISEVLETKMRAINCHRSQTTDLIADDPTGFRLSAETLQRFLTSTEVYLEPVYE